MSTHRVTFKEENYASEPIGPVTVYDVAAYEADPEIVASRDGLGLPYGYVPAGRDDRGWLTLSEAEAIAAELGCELEQR